MPKTKIMKKDIVDVALRAIREQGYLTLNARSIAAILGCSTQPIFSNFSSMEELKGAVIEQADAIFDGYIKAEVEKNIYPPYKASGMAYIRFAREERELFKLLFMRDRSEDKRDNSNGSLAFATDMVKQNTGLSNDKSLTFHLEMWIQVHGIATMIATKYLEWDEALVSHMLTDVYEGLKNVYKVSREDL